MLQEEGLTKGSQFEEMVSLKSTMWLRYIDNIFIFGLNPEDMQILLDHVTFDLVHNGKGN